MKNIKIFKKKALAVLSTGIILTSFAECNLDDNNLVESENPKQSTMEIMKANETEKTAETSSYENNNLSDKIIAEAIALSTILSAIVAINVIWSKEKYKFRDEGLKLETKKKTYHK